jgi:hypothetical protein
MVGPVRGAEPGREVAAAIAPLTVDGGGSGAGGDQVSSPQEARGGAAIGRLVEAPSDGMPSDLPSFDRKVRQPMIQVLVQGRGMEPGCASTEANGLEVVACYARNFRGGATSAH